jgi:hypothetical protein
MVFCTGLLSRGGSVRDPCFALHIPRGSVTPCPGCAAGRSRDFPPRPPAYQFKNAGAPMSRKIHGNLDEDLTCARCSTVLPPNVLRMCSTCVLRPMRTRSPRPMAPPHAHKDARVRTVRTLPDSPTSCDVTRTHRHKKSCRSCRRFTVHGCSSSSRPRSRSSRSTASGPG